MPDVLSALDYLAHPAKHAPAPVGVLFGDEAFLKRLALAEIRAAVLGGDDGEFSFTRFDGREAPWHQVFDELSTMALFGGGRRLVVLDEADDFVAEHRAALEDYVERPKTSGVLVLDVRSWVKTTRLYKALAAKGLSIECKAPSGRALEKWLAARAQQAHGAKLAADAAELLVEITGSELGLLDQELAKLAVSTAAGEAITSQMVGDLVGGWKTKTIWDLLDLAAAGNAREALLQLDKLLLAGENAIGLLAQMASTFRRFAAATRAVEAAEAAKRRIDLRQSLEIAGVKPFVLGKAESQLKQLGRSRSGQLYRWLLEADLDLKGRSTLAPRVILERLVVRLSAQAGKQAAALSAR